MLRLVGISYKLEESAT